MRRHLAVCLLLSACADDEASSGGLDASTHAFDASVVADDRLPLDASFSIEFGRSPCFGACPIYSVRVDQAGLVKFFGVQCVARVGAFKKQIPAADARALYEQLASANVWSFRDRYWMGEPGCTMVSTDAPYLAWDVAAEQRRKTVSHYTGCRYDSRELEQLRAWSERVDGQLGVSAWVGEVGLTCLQKPAQLPPFVSYRVSNGEFTALLTLSDQPRSNAVTPHPRYFITPNPAEPSRLHWQLTDCDEKLLAFGRIVDHPEGRLLLSEDKRPLNVLGARDVGAFLLSSDGTTIKARALLPEGELQLTLIAPPLPSGACVRSP